MVGPEIEYLLIDRSRTLTWLCEIGAIEIHPFLHRASNLDRPTHVVFDLDPGQGTSLVECCEVALLLRDQLLGSGLECLAKGSGGKGIQLFVPLNTATTHDQSEWFARMVAEDLARRNPRKITAKMSKSLRIGKVFIDWSQNAGLQDHIAVYSLRAETAGRSYLRLSFGRNWPGHQEVRCLPPAIRTCRGGQTNRSLRRPF